MSQVSIGIVGLANVGKSTLFNALLKKQIAVSANYPFTTIEPNVGVVEVPDERLQKLADVIANENPKSEILNPKKIQNSNDKNSGKILNQVQNNKRGWVDGWPPIVPAVVQFVDIAGLVRGAHKGEGLGNQFLSHIREVDVICFVVRDFKNPDIIKTGENPKEDLEVLKSELLLKDLETVEKRLGSRDLGSSKDKEILEKVKGLIERGKWLTDELSDEELIKIKDLQLLSAKKAIVVLNCDETDLNKDEAEGTDGALRISAKMEEELAGLLQDEQKEYLKEAGVDEPGLNRLIRIAYDVLGLMSFYTAGEKEVRAWTLSKGSLAPRAAGVIHTDFERGFIAADVVNFDKFVEAGGWKNSRERGLVKTIGRSEVMPNDSIVEFKFSI